MRLIEELRKIAEGAEHHHAWVLVSATAALTALFTWIIVRLIHRITENVEKGAKVKIDRAEVGSEASSAAQRLPRRTKMSSKLVSNVVVWLQVGLGSLLILGILGVNLMALVALAGVVAAMLTFSAQSIIKDLITGAFRVAEDQVDVGDFVDVGTGHAVVEFVGLRVTQVRDDYGVLRSVRNGGIDKVAAGAGRPRGRHQAAWHE